MMKIFVRYIKDHQANDILTKNIWIELFSMLKANYYYFKHIQQYQYSIRFFG